MAHLNEPAGRRVEPSGDAPATGDVQPPNAPSCAVVIRPDVHCWWIPIAGNAIRGAVMFTVIASFPAADGAFGVALAFPLIGVAIGACLGLIGSVLWLLGPARTTYAVTDGYLVARRGKAIRLRVPAEHVARLDIGEDLTWRTMTLERWFSYAPFDTPSADIEIKTGDRWSPDDGERDLPRILLWGSDHRRSAERQLREALGLIAATGDP